MRGYSLYDRTLIEDSTAIESMHPLVRNLYKRVLIVGRDYPTGIEHVKSVWKKAIRNPQNCPSWYEGDGSRARTGNSEHHQNEEELLRAVHKGRVAVKEMIGVIQFKKYRSMKRRYSDRQETNVGEIMATLERRGGT